MNIAVIPARGGSKRIPRKNIKPFHGKPMIAWSIEAARESGVFDRIIVSTDDNEIMDIARNWGAEVPFKRPPELSNDYAGTIEVIAHATRWALAEGMKFNAVCCIYATAPFVQALDVAQGLEALESGDWAYAFSCTDFPAPIFRSFEKSAEGGVRMFFPQHFTARSQDLPEALHDAAQFYWGRPESWIDGKRIFDVHSKPILLPRWRVQDIDNQADWDRAELIAPSILDKFGGKANAQKERFLESR
jgi:N-acylneuraminate cytidylyltransferase